MISILYCGNDKIFKGLMISLVSVALHTDAPLDVHILTMDLKEVDENYTAISSEQTDFIEKIIKEYNSDSKITRHDVRNMFLKELKKSPNIFSRYTPYTLLRLFCDKLPLPDKILYLDTDTAACKNILPLYETDINNHEFAGVIDYLGRVFIARDYVNAGVLLLNLKLIRENGFFEKCRRFVAEKKAAFPDQDAIHHTENNKAFLNRKYNEQRRMYDDTVIRHFSKSIRWLPVYHTVNIKPWDIEGMHKVYKNFAFDDVLEIYTEKYNEWQSKKFDEEVTV